MPCFDGELHAKFGMRVTCPVSMASYMQFFECELHATFQRRLTCNVWNASYMPCFDGELHATSGMRVTCHVSTASCMQRLEYELHATFRRRVTRNVWNVSYMPRLDGELHGLFQRHVSTASYIQCRASEPAGGEVHFQLCCQCKVTRLKIAMLWTGPNCHQSPQKSIFMPPKALLEMFSRRVCRCRAHARRI